jgi:hypothetical protein
VTIERFARFGRVTVGRTVVLALLALVSIGGSGCREEHPDDDPDSHDRPEGRAAFEARLREVSLQEVVAAVGAVPVRDAPRLLATWLEAAGPSARVVLAAWPRRADGLLDLARGPLVARAVEGTIEANGGSAKTSNSRCGDVAVIFRGLTAPSFRLRLAVPATSRTCRRAVASARIEDDEALVALREAIAAAKVPDFAQPVAAAP